MSWRVLGAALSLVAASACSRTPSDEQLRAWLDEAKRENEELAKRNVDSEAASWTLSVRGNVAGGGADYHWRDIVSMATTHIKTTCPTHTSDVNAVVDYRGIEIAGLLDSLQAREGPGPGGTELTIVAADGYIGTRKLAEMRRFPVILAIEEGGVPLTKNTGGPLMELYPHTSHPESKALYAEGGAYYVTTLIVGTEPLALQVGGARRFSAKEMNALPQRTVVGKSGFKFRWPSTDVAIHGPRVRDVLAAASIPLGPGDRVVVRRKPRTDVPQRESTTLRAEDVLACDVVIGLRHGEKQALLPAAMGGPAVLAFGPECVNKPAPWPMFVEAIDVVRGEPDGG